MANEKPLKVRLNISLINCEGKPAIQLKKTISREDKVRALIKHAMEKGEIPATIIFKDPLKAAVKLKALGFY